MSRSLLSRFHPVMLLTFVVIGAGLLAPGTVGWLMERPLRCIVSMASHLGLPLTWHDGGIRMGSVQVPWSEDCTGIAYFVTLPAVAAFASWLGGTRWSFTRIVILPLVLAGLVNAARVAFILIYRLSFAPEVESPQLHYLLGFIGLLPALYLLLPKQTLQTHGLACLELSAALGLLCPHLSAPGGVRLFIAVMMIVWRRSVATEQRSAWWQWALWLLSFAWIAMSQMESLWLPWLLSCPWRGVAWHREPETLFALACTIPLVAMQSWSPVVLGAVLMVMLLRWMRGFRSDIHPGVVASPAQRFALSACFLLPFISIAYSQNAAALAPPSSLKPTQTAKNSYEVHLNHQPAGLRADWIAAQGGGRHHTVQVCMAYRGEHLHEAQSEGPVFTDGSVLRREFFLFPDALVSDYDGYLRRTFWPGSDTGVHLIFSAAASSMSPAHFETECRALAARVREHCRPSYASQP